MKKKENDKLNKINDELIKEKQEKGEKINEYQNELYIVNNTHSQKMIELSNELEQKIENLENEKKRTRTKNSDCRK